METAAARAKQPVRPADEDELHAKYRNDLHAALAGLKAEYEIERRRLNAELLQAVEIASQLGAEKSGLIAEVFQVKADFASRIEEAREEAKAIAAKPTGTPDPSAPAASIQQEIDRTEAKLQEIAKLLDTSGTDLATVIRKNVEKSELEAYLKGIRLVLTAKT